MNNGAKKQAGTARFFFCTVFVILCAPTPTFAQAIADVEINTPRAFGYTIGDKIRHEMQLSLRPPYRLDRSTLPKTGRLNRWLEVSAADATTQRRDELVIVVVTIDYQIFNVPQKLSSVVIPQLEFVLAGGDNPLPVFLPEWTFSIAPIATVGPRPESRLQPDRPPSPIDLGGRSIRLLITALLFSALLSYLAYWRWLLPRLRRASYPFTHALARLQQLPRSASDPENYKLGLRIFHGALNTTAGHVVFEDKLRNFLRAHSQYRTVRGELATFFDQSRDVFFDNSRVATPDASLHELIRLCRLCRKLERSVV